MCQTAAGSFTVSPSGTFTEYNGLYEVVEGTSVTVTVNEQQGWANLISGACSCNGSATEDWVASGDLWGPENATSTLVCGGKSVTFTDQGNCHYFGDWAQDTGQCCTDTECDGGTCDWGAAGDAAPDVLHGTCTGGDAGDGGDADH
jgi:hypothetical protein